MTQLEQRFGPSRQLSLPHQATTLSATSFFRPPTPHPRTLPLAPHARAPDRRRYTPSVGNIPLVVKLEISSPVQRSPSLRKMPRAPQGLRVSANRGREAQPDSSSPGSLSSPKSPFAKKKQQTGSFSESTSTERDPSMSSHRQQSEPKAIPRRPVPGVPHRADSSRSPPGSTTDLPIGGVSSSFTSESAIEVVDDVDIPRLQANGRSNSDIVNRQRNTSKQLLPGLTRTKSGRSTEEQKTLKTRARYAGGKEMKKKGTREFSNSGENGLKEDRKLKEAVGWNSWRNRSADRAGVQGMGGPEPSHEKHGSNSSNFLSNFRDNSSRVVAGVERAGRGFMTRFQNRDENSPTRQPDPNVPYVCKIINLPLVEQTRKTRITKTLPECMDKTEFWMPALPWRCIDYLNSEACMSEGIYRQSGSLNRIRLYERRFDTELDIDLLSPKEKDELGDVNIIASMFKSWIRNQPSLIIPKDVQDRVTKRWREEGEKEEVPQYLKDELSQLPPYHYYLLFAITCHISLVYNFRDENKMTFQNLRICFAPTMNIDTQIFKWLIENWRECWQGCHTEEEYLNEEYNLSTQQGQNIFGTDGTMEEHSTTAHSQGSRPSTRTQSPGPQYTNGKHEARGNGPEIEGSQASLQPRGQTQTAPMLSPVKRLDPLGDFMS